MFVLLIGVGFFSYSLFATPSLEALNTKIVVSEENNNGSRFQFTRDNLAETLPTSIPGIVEEKVSKNLTDRVANLYTGEIVKVNKNDSASIKNSGTLTLPSQDIFDTTFNTILQEPLTFASFTKNDVAISSDNSLSAKRAYFLTLQTTVSSQMKNSKKEIDALTVFFSKQDGSLLAQFLGTLNKSVNDLLKMRVPSELVLFHLQALNTFQKKLEVYNAISNINIDPVKTVVAIDEIPKIAGEIKDISVEISKHI